MKNNEKKYKFYATIETSVFFVLLFLLLWFVTIHKTEVEDNEIEVEFEEARMGGVSAARRMQVSESDNQPSAPSASSASSPNMLTQRDESVYVPSQEELEKRREEAEQKKKREQERLEEERRKTAEAKALAEKKAREKAAIDKANQLGELFGKTDGKTAKGAEEGQGIGAMGNPVGHGSMGGNSWSLEGRDLVGPLPKPRGDKFPEGIVEISILVNENGDVVKTDFGRKTNISDGKTKEMAREAAKKAKFSPTKPGSGSARGSIIYKFKVN